VHWPIHFLLLAVCGDCLECHQSKKSRDVELLFPHEYCIARLLVQIGSFFKGIRDRNVLHHQLPCSWTSKSFTCAKNLARDENDDSLITGKQRYYFSYWRIFHLRIVELIPSLAV
jgi:hypothetical protein